MSAHLKPSHSPSHRINLGLQGGGSHGAFTWGVLDVLLQDERIAIEPKSGSYPAAGIAVVGVFWGIGGTMRSQM